MPGHRDDEGHKHWVFEYDPGKEDTALLLTMKELLAFRHLLKEY